MKIKSRANGAVIDISDEGAKKLIDARIYDAVAEQPPKEPAPKKDPPPKKSDKSTKVEPMTTEDMPVVPTKQVT